MYRRSSGGGSSSSSSSSSQACFSIYPSRGAIESISIPNSTDVFQRVGTTSPRSRTDPDPTSDSRKAMATLRRKFSPRGDVENLDPALDRLNLNASCPSQKEAPSEKRPSPETFPKLTRGGSSISIVSNHSNSDCTGYPSPLEEQSSSPSPECGELKKTPRVEEEYVPPARMELEVSPGNFLPLYGSQETIRALHQGRMRQTGCILCQHILYCVASADYVLCPTCRVVSPAAAPIKANHNNDSHRATGFHKQQRRHSSASPAGVGLGMTPQDYTSWQQENAAVPNNTDKTTTSRRPRSRRASMTVFG